jgi:hypothetical protein
VQLGPIVQGKRVVRAGLEPCDQIVVNGLQRVRPGMPVTPQTEYAGSETRMQTAQRSTEDHSATD